MAGLKTVPVKTVKFNSEEEAVQYAIADNKANEWAEWDDVKLKDLDIEFDLIDFNIEEEQAEVIEDEPPDIEKEPKYKIKNGEVWQLGTHRLMCGDSTNKEQIDTLMNGNKADMVFTDPPYGMFLNTDFSGMKGIGTGNKFDKVIGDNEDFKPELITTPLDYFKYCKEIFLWGADYYAEIIPGRNKGAFIVWDKMSGGDGCNDSYDKMFGSNFELCWSKSKHKRAIARVLWKGIFGLSDEPDKKKFHPTQKPVKLSEWFLNKFSDIQNLIVDLYGGSGSTLIACEQLNRVCCMMELDEKYCSVIIERWENLTGNKAERIV